MENQYQKNMDQRMNLTVIRMENLYKSLFLHEILHEVGLNDRQYYLNKLLDEMQPYNHQVKENHRPSELFPTYDYFAELKVLSKEAGGAIIQNYEENRNRIKSGEKGERHNLDENQLYRQKQ